MPHEIRRMRSKSDAHELRLIGALEKECPRYFPTIRYPRDTDRVFVASCEEGIVGGVHYRYFSGGFTKIGEIFVHPNHRSKGVGRNLFKAVEEIAVSEGKKEIDVRSNEESKDFYRKFGFHEFHDTTRRKKYNMKKLLAPVEKK